LIKCFINADGYYISGEDLEIVRKLTPITENGKQLLDPLQHLYLVMYSALVDLKGITGSQIFVYNDSRIIDDLNGQPTLNEWFSVVRTMIRQRLLPEINGVVFFRKKPAREIADNISGGMNSLCIDDSKRDKRLLKYIDTQIKEYETIFKRKITNLKRRWFDAET
jgi:hypothetical protein